MDPMTDILITVGAYAAMQTALQGLVDEDDEVIIIEPFFDSYDRMVLLAGGIPRYIPLRPKIVCCYYFYFLNFFFSEIVSDKM